MTPTYRHRTLGCTTTKPPCRPLPGRNWVTTCATRLRSRPLRNWPHPPRPPTTDRDLGELDWLVCSLSIISIITTVYTGNPLTSPDLNWSGLQTSLSVYVANDKWYRVNVLLKFWELTEKSFSLCPWNFADFNLIPCPCLLLCECFILVFNRWPPVK